MPIQRTPLEIYVKQWLKANTVKYAAGLNLLRRAAAYIDEKIATDCCDPDNPIINLYTRKESVFVRDVYTMLYGMSRNGHIQSLTRTRNAILNYVTDPCCFADNTTFDFTVSPNGTVHSTANPYALVITFTTAGPFVDSGDVAYTTLFLNGVAVATLQNSAGTFTYNIANATTGTQAFTYYVVAYSQDANASAQSETFNLSLVNP
jgi:hypothetical protein